MHSVTVWRYAERPNYTTNIDKVFPYSEVPYLGEYHLEKIPASLNNLIAHVDYWGEGRIVAGEGISGFPNSYNINHQYQLVSRGPDVDKKIPNRIPISSYADCDTSSYIKDNSVIIVTVAGPHINSSCAKDIARIINQDHGKVVVFGVNSTSQEIESLANELKKKNLLPCPDATLSSELHGLTLYDSHVAFLNKNLIKDELSKKITKGNYDSAVFLGKGLESASAGENIKEIVTKLIDTYPQNVLAFAYKLWQGDAKSIVRDYFPESFRLIFNGDDVTLINKKYGQALKLDANTDYYHDRLVWGDSHDVSSKRVSWRIIPVWHGNSVSFKLYNIDCNMYLKLDVNVDNIGDRKAWGSSNSDEERHKYYLVPKFHNGTLLFSIINCQYDQPLKLAVGVDSYGDRLLWGHNGGIGDDYGRFGWLIESWQM